MGKLFVSLKTEKLMNYKYQVSNEVGLATLLGVILIMSIGLTITSSFIFFSISHQRILRNEIFSMKSYYGAESGVEDAVYRIKNTLPYSSNYNINVNDTISTVNVTTNNNSITVESTGDQLNRLRTVSTTINITTVNPQFFYGAQVGEGGLTMGNNATINGSVYSNGSITGSNGAKITDTAIVAVGTPPTIDQTWTTYNIDYGAGINTGSIVTTLDSSGDVGTYTSIALGSDNFVRISYVDRTNWDLKLARCLDANCISRVLTTIAGSDIIDESTSIALDSNNFAHISYYDDGNDDQEFVRCTNADCTTRNFTTIESANNVGDANSINLGSDGFARIAYFQDTNNDVKFTRCLDADCATKNINDVETTGNLGEYQSLDLGTDGFARISYYDDTNRDLKFARCLDADCATKNITVVDSSGSVGRYNSLALGSDGFARISYYDYSNRDLKFIRCVDVDCTIKNITTVDSSGSVGEYTSIALGSDGFARISYYDSSNADLKFVQCLNDDCTSKNINTVDNTSSVGQYTSLTLGSDSFARISYYDSGAKDLKYVRCLDSSCLLSLQQTDLGQSFQPSLTSRIVKTDLYLKKVGTPLNATLKIIADSSNSPSTLQTDILATGFIDSSKITNSYNWLTVNFSTTPTLSANTTYWLVLDTINDNNNYLVWGGDSNDAYTRGTAKRSSDLTIGNWQSLNDDLNFSTYMGGSDNQIYNMTINGTANAHILDTVTIDGDANGFTLNNSTVGGSVSVDNISNCTIGGNASYNFKNNCTIGGNEITPNTPPSDSPLINMPISDDVITEWKNAAAAGGNCIEPTCDNNGNLILTNGITLSIGPKKITGNLTLDNNAVLILTGTLWVEGTITLSNNCSVKLDSSYGDLSGVILNDSTTTVSNGCIFAGSGNTNSFIMLLTAKDDPNNTVMSIDNNALGIIYYASKGRIHFSNISSAKEATAYGITMDNNATITYDSGLINAQFSSGPGGNTDITNWKEIP